MVTWYEKTVEYAFVRKFLNIDAMPLSGTAEKIGDTIFHEKNQFYIVEFKRGLDLGTECNSERNKYLNVEQSIEKLSENTSSSSHYIIIGGINESNEFELKYDEYVYFLKEEYTFWNLNSNSISEVFTPIDNLGDLKTYLQLLINEKEASSKDSSSVDYGNTLIVDKDGNACALSDKDGLAELELKFKIPKPVQENKSSNKLKK